MLGELSGAKRPKTFAEQVGYPYLIDSATSLARRVYLLLFGINICLIPGIRLLRLGFVAGVPAVFFLATFSLRITDFNKYDRNTFPSLSSRSKSVSTDPLRTGFRLRVNTAQPNGFLESCPSQTSPSKTKPHTTLRGIQ
ncbi:uncharacterized protein EI90DRAFT_629909 [Cantharellus anzutake]|uniref:uncharacterized protein n=1 Tax=Cantharellus anzutake TaxID=1750568 RepID=UPI0019068E8A|nr:uncharacterized protein EI90DRAFT_629909 [Cantharellus anzutake]KAF8333109.1 hypothetical protein EI90DRAFT_629909 [Cantharellus anzutake]